MSNDKDRHIGSRNLFVFGHLRLVSYDISCHFEIRHSPNLKIRELHEEQSAIFGHTHRCKWESWWWATHGWNRSSRDCLFHFCVCCMTNCLLWHQILCQKKLFELVLWHSTAGVRVKTSECKVRSPNIHYHFIKLTQGTFTIPCLLLTLIADKLSRDMFLGCAYFPGSDQGLH